MPYQQSFHAPSGATQSDARLASSVIAAAEESGREETNTSLEDAGRAEREYVRERVRAELGREPSEEELNEWVRAHTEGH